MNVLARAEGVRLASQISTQALPGASADENLPESISRRVVFLVNSTDFGGASQHALNIAGELQRLGVAVLLVVPPGNPMVAKAVRQGIPIKELHLGLNIGRWRGFLGSLVYLNPLSRWRSIRLILELHRERPSIFICPFPREQLLTGAIYPRHDVRSVWIVHAPFHYLSHRLLVDNLWIRTAVTAEAVVAVSKGLGSHLRLAGVPERLLDIIPNAVALPTSEDMSWTPRVPFLIGTASRLVKSKGIQYLIAAMPTVLQKYPQARLAIAGTGKYEGALRRQVARLRLKEQVTFLGYLPNPLEFFSSLQVLVHPSVDEVMPTVILEAESVSTPVVASDTGSIPDQIVDGVTGFLVEPADVRGLAGRVLAVLEDMQRSNAMGEAGQRLLQQEYLLDQAGRRYFELLRQVDLRPAQAAGQHADTIT